MRIVTSRFGPLSFYREALAIALPVMLQQFIMSMASLVDNFMVAGLGDVSMASVNVAGHIVFIYIVIIHTICQAGGIYIAQFRGAGNHEGMQQAYRFKVLFAFTVAVLCFIVCQTMPHWMIAMMTTGNAAQEDIMQTGTVYLKIVSWSFFFMAISFAVGTSFREIARPKVTLVISATATLVSTVGNWLLIYGNLGAPRLEVAGAAYSTLAARAVEMTVFLIYAAKVKAPFFVGIKRILSVHWKFFRDILWKSGMIFVAEMSWIASETIMIAMYNRRGGAEIVAGMAAGWTIANIFFLIFGGIWTACGVLVGGSLGAGKLDEARIRAKWLKSGAVVLGIIIALPGVFFANLLVPLVFSNLSAAARANCIGLVAVILAYLPIWSYLNVQFAVTRAGGDTATGMYTDLSVNALLFAPGAVILSFFTTLPPVPMFALLKLTDFVKIAIARHFLRKERWVKNLAERDDKNL
ncbi:MAG: MATE family efflux transporter [Treponema sp.]|nr:MATE family efflux transporter [Treponema sp.]